MGRRKTFQELTLKDDFMFSAVMSEASNCRELLEMVLGFSIGDISVSKEKSIIYNPDYKSVRLDIYAKDKDNKHYDVEMQSVKKSSLGKRSRYYHSQMDMESLLAGLDYSQLSDSYVIFICDFDPFGAKKYCYTFRMNCNEADSAELKDGTCTIFLSTCGTNPEEIPESLVKFLKFIGSDLSESTCDFQDDYESRIQKAIQQMKQDRGLEGSYMLWQGTINEYIREAQAEGRAEGRAEGLALGKAENILELLQDYGTVPEELKTRIMSEKDLQTLSRWNRLAARVSSIEAFLKDMN